MFEPTDFKLSLEKELKLRLIETEVANCTDIDALKEQLLLCSKSLMTYQHMVGEMIKRDIQRDLKTMPPEISKIVKDMIGKSDGSSSSG